MRRFIGTVAFFLLLGTGALSADQQTDWPSFHGPDRDNRSNETGLLRAWPEGGPKLLWTASGLGHGYSSVAVVGNRIFTAGMFGKDTHIACIGPDAGIIWQRLAGKSWEASERQRWAVPYSGSRATPTVDGDTVYFLSELGTLTAFMAANGDERWSLDLARTFEADKPKYGYSESVLVDGNRLFCSPGGKKGYMVAVDKRNGRVLWVNSEINDVVGNSSSVLAEIAGVKQVVSLSSARVFAVDPEGGGLLWQYPFGNKRGNSATDVIVEGGLVYASCGYGKGSILLRPERTDDGSFAVNRVWESKLLDNHHGGVVLVDGSLYGAGHVAKGWFSLAFLGGGKNWQKAGKGSLTYADDHLYFLDEKGQMSLVLADSKKYTEVARFTVPKGGRGPYWAHPVVCNGRLYIRHSDQLYAYDIRESSQTVEMGAMGKKRN
ncbi:MAG: PQQ-binding-like beta-propeller repeat protein [Desulfobacterales bacterium]